MKMLMLVFIAVIITNSCKIDIYKKHEKYAKKYQNKLIKKGKKEFSIVKSSKKIIIPSKLRPNITNLDPIKAMISTYVETHNTAYPKYFILNTTGLITYLKNKDPMPPYLQFYMSINNQSADLCIIPTKDDENDEQFHYMHIPTDTAFGNLTSSAICGVKYDSLLDSIDYSKHVPNYPPVNLPLAASTIIDTSIAHARIKNYQLTYQFEYDYSLIINSSLLYSFLTNANLQIPQQAAAIPFLQIYLANTDRDITKATLVIVGLDNTGNHVYYNADGDQDVFEAAVPCPYCGVLPDPNIDGNIAPQLIMGHHKRAKYGFR